MKTIRIFGIHPDLLNIDSIFRDDIKDNYFNDFSFVWTDNKPDYLIVSEVIYSDRSMFKLFKKISKHSKILIFIGGEAVIPDLNVFDYAVTYDSRINHSDRIVQSPSRTLNLVRDNPHFENKLSHNSDIDRVFASKTKFMNFIYSNGFSHPFRDKFFKAMNSIKGVDSLGKHLNNVNKNIPKRKSNNWLEESIILKREYKFSIAIENAIMPGYTSEKMLTSLLANTVPIYWGNPDINKEINPECFINLHDYNDLNEAIEHILEINDNEQLYKKMISAPWKTEDQIKKEISRDDKYYEFWKNIFLQDLSEAKRTPEGTFNYFYISFANRPYYYNSFYIKVILKKIIEKFKTLI